MLTLTFSFQTSRYGILSCLHWILIHNRKCEINRKPIFALMRNAFYRGVVLTHSNFVSDCLGGGINSIKAKINSLTVRADLTRYGFVTNEEKSLWEPVQVTTWLSTVFDTCLGFTSVTEQRVSKRNSSIDLLRNDD